MAECNWGTSVLRSSMDRRVIGERSDAVLRTAMPGDDKSLRCRDAATHPSFAYAKKNQAKKRRPKNSSLKRREAERREAHHRAASRSDAARVLSPVSPLREDRGPGLHKALDLMERARSPFGAPPRHPRFLGLGSAQAALPGTTGCKREDPLRHQCSEHLAVRHAPDGTMPKPPASAVYRCAQREPLPLRPKEYPRERRPFASGIVAAPWPAVP